MRGRENLIQPRPCSPLAIGRIPFASTTCRKNWSEETPSWHLLGCMRTPYSLKRWKMSWKYSCVPPHYCWQWRHHQCKHRRIINYGALCQWKAETALRNTIGIQVNWKSPKGVVMAVYECLLLPQESDDMPWLNQVWKKWQSHVEQTSDPECGEWDICSVP